MTSEQNADPRDNDSRPTGERMFSAAARAAGWALLPVSVGAVVNGIVVSVGALFLTIAEGKVSEWSTILAIGAAIAAALVKFYEEHRR